MNIWLVRDLEPLPTDPDKPRLMRMGILAQMLARKGHSVRWITSSFDHYQKRQRDPRAHEIVAEENLCVTILPGRGYSGNIGLARIAHNRGFARAFTKFAFAADNAPDIIITDIPTTETAAAAAEFSLARGIKLIVSVRDIWPDSFTSLVPPLLTAVATPLLYPLERQARFACAHASAIVGISRGYLDWGLKKAGRVQGPHDRVIPHSYVPNPLPCASKRQSVLAGMGVKDGCKLVVFIGSWGHSHDLGLVLGAASKLASRRDIQFLIAGHGEQTNKLKPRLSRLSNVLLPGWLNAEEIAIVLDRAEIGLLPYRNDAPQSLPNKALEYLAHGTFQIATIAGELRPFYASTNGGTVLATVTPDALASEIATTLYDPQTAANRPSRLAHFKDRWSAQRVYCDFLDLIDALNGTDEAQPPRMVSIMPSWT